MAASSGCGGSTARTAEAPGVKGEAAAVTEVTLPTVKEPLNADASAKSELAEVAEVEEPSPPPRLRDDEEEREIEGGSESDGPGGSPHNYGVLSGLVGGVPGGVYGGVPGGVYGGVPGVAVGGVSGGVYGGVPGGVVGGMPGGVLGGVPGGVVGQPPPPSDPNAVIPFGAGMNRPVKVSGPEPTYSKEAIRARAEGMSIVKCTIRKDGSADNCRAIKSVPFLTEAAIASIKSSRFTPVIYQSRAVNVDYVFVFRFVLPAAPAAPPPAQKP